MKARPSKGPAEALRQGLPVVDGGLVAQIQLGAGGGQEGLEPLILQAAHDRRSDEAAVAGDVDPRGRAREGVREPESSTYRLYSQ